MTYKVQSYSVIRFEKKSIWYFFSVRFHAFEQLKKKPEQLFYKNCNCKLLVFSLCKLKASSIKLVSKISYEV